MGTKIKSDPNREGKYTKRAKQEQGEKVLFRHLKVAILQAEEGTAMILSGSLTINIYFC